MVWQPRAVTGLSALVASEPLETWKDYLTFHAINSRAAVLPGAVGRQAFAFYGPVLSGAQKQRDRWKRGVTATNAALGFAVGKLYAERYFPAAEKARAKAMVTNIMAAFAARIDALDWMAPATKKEAKAKLAVLKVGVGYPRPVARLRRPGGHEGGRLRQRGAGASCSSSGGGWPGSTSRSTATSG